MLKEKHDQWVLETVDCLRQRKARPDFLRICRMVERFHGLTVNETRESLERLTSMGIVLKVFFKGNISYRHVKNTDKGSEPETGQISQLYNTSLRLAQAIKSIMKQTGDSASFCDLESWLISKTPDTRLVKHRLQTALKREIDSKNIAQLSDKTYILTEDLPNSKDHPSPIIDSKKNNCVDHAQESPKKKPDVSKPATSTTLSNVNSTNEKQKETEEYKKRSRPLSKRKKFKKTHGPDFENPLQVKRSYSKDCDKNLPLTCGYCSKTAQSNNEGKSEPLLTCTDCDSKAHPSCMDYSEELARRALNSPWQCMDCKTCFLCEGSENADLMLFCDACDKGYHMTCHEPPLVNKPKGTWICSLCTDEMESKGKLEDQNKHSDKKGAIKTDSDGSHEEDEETSKIGKKRKLSREKSATLPKWVKTSPCPDDTSTVCTNKPTYEDYPDGTSGASCLPTPSASPRASDTFDYEMKMSQMGFPVSIIYDSTTYTDATNWKTDDVVKFFEDCGFKENAQAFKDQEVDGRSLLLMQRNDVLTGLGLKLGPALKIYQKVVKLQIFSQVASL